VRGFFLRNVINYCWSFIFKWTVTYELKWNCSWEFYEELRWFNES
jgi:hypothetical protein